MDRLIDNNQVRDAQMYLPFNGRYRVAPNPVRVYKCPLYWFGNFKGINNWYDSEYDNVVASGLSQNVPGVAYMCQTTLKHWFKITFPNGKTFIVRQVDIGQSNWTRKIIDVNAPLAEMAGYTPKNFPTGADILFTYIGKNKPDETTEIYRR